MKKYITQERIKQNNLADIFSFVLEKASTTRREIESETGFSWGTVSSNVSYLIEQGYLVEEKAKASSVGRTTNILRVNGDKHVSVGIDVNRTQLRAEVVGLDLSLKKVFTQKFTAKTQQELINEVEDIINVALTFCKDKFNVFSLGIAFQGVVDGKNGISVRFPGFDNWQALDVKEYFSQKFSLPVYFAHDPKCALMGALANNNVKDCVLVRIDDGIGMAVCQDYKILDDLERFELGHTITVIDGKKITLQQVASMRGISERAGVSFDDVILNLSTYSAIFNQAIDALSLALYNVCVLFRPKKLILTGRAMEYSEFTNLLKKQLVLENSQVDINSNVSASFGAATQSVRSAIKNFYL